MKGILNENGRKKSLYTAFGETEFGEMGFGKTGFGETGRHQIHLHHLHLPGYVRLRITRRLAHSG